VWRSTAHIVGSAVGACDGASVATLGDAVARVGTADGGTEGCADGGAVCCVGAALGTAEAVGDADGGAVASTDGSPVGPSVGAPVGLSVGDADGDGDGVGTPVEGGTEGRADGAVDGATVGCAVDGGQVGATQATVSDVEHARSLATPSMGCATARARAAAPPARLAAESAQETPEEQSPAQARRQSPRVGRASLCGQFGRRAMQTSPEALRCAAADSGAAEPNYWC
jgi:hypothetical protein